VRKPNAAPGCSSHEFGGIGDYERNRPLTAPKILSAIHVVIAIDAANAEPANVLLRSIRAHLARHRHLYFHVIYSGPGAPAFERLTSARLVNTSIRSVILENPFEKWGSSGYISSATLTRLLIPRLLTGVGRAVYLDADVLVMKDITPLYNTKLGSALVGGCLDFPLLFEVDHGLYGTEEYLNKIVGVRDARRYINAGVLVMNLNGLRGSRFVERAEALLERTGANLKFRDQDIINSLLQDEVMHLDPRWNSMITMHRQPQFRTPELQNAVALQQSEPGILHYAGPDKPWHTGYQGPPLDLWSSYVAE